MQASCVELGYRIQKIEPGSAQAGVNMALETCPPIGKGVASPEEQNAASEDPIRRWPTMSLLALKQPCRIAVEPLLLDLIFQRQRPHLGDDALEHIIRRLEV